MHTKIVLISFARFSSISLLQGAHQFTTILRVCTKLWNDHFKTFPIPLNKKKIFFHRRVPTLKINWWTSLSKASPRGGFLAKAWTRKRRKNEIGWNGKRRRRIPKKSLLSRLQARQIPAKISPCQIPVKLSTIWWIRNSNEFSIQNCLTSCQAFEFTVKVRGRT